MATACLDLRKKLRINKFRRPPVHRTGQLQSDTGARLAKLRNPPGLTAWKVLLAICLMLVAVLNREVHGRINDLRGPFREDC